MLICQKTLKILQSINSDEQIPIPPSKTKVDFTRYPSPPKLKKTAESPSIIKMDANSIARRPHSPTVRFSSPIASSSRAYPSVDSQAVSSQPKMCPSGNIF